jgi:hypothetical protein
MGASPAVFADSNVLYSAALRDILIEFPKCKGGDALTWRRSSDRAGGVLGWFQEHGRGVMALPS